jgi:hypothetical protein
MDRSEDSSPGEIVTQWRDEYLRINPMVSLRYEW